MIEGLCVMNFPPLKRINMTLCASTRMKVEQNVREMYEGNEQDVA